VVKNVAAVIEANLPDAGGSVGKAELLLLKGIVVPPGFAKLFQRWARQHLDQRPDRKLLSILCHLKTLVLGPILP